MGYRSDVAIAIAAPSVDALREFLAVAKVTLNYPADMINDELSCYSVKIWGDEDDNPRPCVMYAQFQDVKWYPDFKDVHLHTDLIELAQDSKLATKFVRIGEDADDVVEEMEVDFYEGSTFDAYDMMGDIYIVRSIHLSNVIIQDSTPALDLLPAVPPKP